MNKILLTISLSFLLMNCATTQPSTNSAMLETTDIAALTAYINSNPKDKNIDALKERLVVLQNATKETVVTPVAPVPKTAEEQEAELFEKLIEEQKTNGGNSTASAVNQMLSNDVSDKNGVIIVKNNSDCNLVLRINGKDGINLLAVPAKKESSIVLPKDTYVISGKLCSANYSSTKVLKSNLHIVLSSD